MILFYVCIGIICLCGVIAILSESTTITAFAACASWGALLLALAISDPPSKSPDSAQMEPPTPVVSCTEPQQGPPRPSDTELSKRTFSKVSPAPR